MKTKINCFQDKVKIKSNLIYFGGCIMASLTISQARVDITDKVEAIISRGNAEYYIWDTFVSWDEYSSWRDKVDEDSFDVMDMFEDRITQQIRKCTLSHDCTLEDAYYAFKHALKQFRTDLNCFEVYDGILYGISNSSDVVGLIPCVIDGVKSYYAAIVFLSQSAARGAVRTMEEERNNIIMLHKSMFQKIGTAVCGNIKCDVDYFSEIVFEKYGSVVYVYPNSGIIRIDYRNSRGKMISKYRRYTPTFRHYNADDSHYENSGVKLRMVDSKGNAVTFSTTWSSVMLAERFNEPFYEVTKYTRCGRGKTRYSVDHITYTDIDAPWNLQIVPSSVNRALGSQKSGLRKKLRDVNKFNCTSYCFVDREFIDKFTRDDFALLSE